MQRRIGVLLVLLGAISIGVGFLMGQHEGVFRKAMLICFECIGIG